MYRPDRWYGCMGLSMCSTYFVHAIILRHANTTGIRLRKASSTHASFYPAGFQILVDLGIEFFFTANDSPTNKDLRKTKPQALPRMRMPQCEESLMTLPLSEFGFSSDEVHPDRRSVSDRADSDILVWFLIGIDQSHLSKVRHKVRHLNRC